MAITKIQQSQISGSLSQDDSLSAGVSLTGKSTLKGDLDALRSQVKRIIGKSNWYADLDGSQDLADIYAAVRMSGADADFQGKVDVTGVATLDSALYVAGPAGLSGSLDVAGIASFAQAANVGGNLHVGGGYGDTGVSVYANGNLSMDGALVVKGSSQFDGSVILGDASSDSITFNAKAGSALDMNTYKISNLAQASATGDALAWGQNASVANASVGGQLWVAGAAGLSGSLAVAGAATLSGGAVISNLSVSGTGSISGALSAGSISTAGTLSAGASTLSSLSVTSTSTFGGNVSVTGGNLTLSANRNLTVGGTTSLVGAATLSGGAVISGLAVVGTGSFTGAISGGNGLTISSGATSVQSFSATSSAISGNETVGGTLGVTGAITGGNGLTISAGSTSLQGLSATSATISGASSLAAVTASGVATFNGLVDVNAGMSASIIKIDGDVAQRLYIVDADGSIKDESKLVFDGSDLAITGGLRVSGNAQVDGDLLVKGAFTYIETENMKVKDAFIYLATGSNGSVDSGLVFSKGAGNNWDLIVGQDGGAGELIFAKQSHSASMTSPAALNGSSLVPAWMSQAKIGSVEGSMVGSISKSGSDFLVAADGAAELKLQSAGNAAISFASASQVPDASFMATTVVGMLNELRIDLDNASAGGNLKKQAYLGTAVSAGVLNFGGLGTLPAAQHKLLDVFVNGVLMAPGYDLTGITTTTVTFDGSYSFTADDVITVVIRG